MANFQAELHIHLNYTQLPLLFAQLLLKLQV